MLLRVLNDSTYIKNFKEFLIYNKYLVKKLHVIIMQNCRGHILMKYVPAYFTS